MGDPSFFIAVARDFVLNWDRLSERKKEAILEVLRRWGAKCLPRTFESLMKVFDKTKFYGYLVPPITTVLSDLLPIFPQTGYAIFIAYSHPVVFVFNPSARAYRILIGKQSYDNVRIDEYRDLEAAELEANATDDELDEADTQAEEAKTEAEPEEKKEEGVSHPAVRRSKRLRTAAPKERSQKKKKRATRKCATSVTARFRNELVLPLLALPATEDPEVFFQRRGFEVEAPLSQHEVDLIAKVQQLMPWRRIPY